MRPPTKRWPWLVIIPLAIAMAAGQASIDEQNLVRDPKSGRVLLNADGRPRYRYRPRHTLVPRTGEHFLDRVSQFTPAILLGTKSALTDILWVRADSYFTDGRYEKIVPLCELITWLNPQFLDVYVIGGWHMAYNFLDRRYIPAGLAFLARGIHNNPSEAYLYFERGHTLYDKAQRFDEAAADLRKANELGLKPAGNRHALPHALESAGRIDEAIAAWAELIREEKKAGNWQMAQVSRHNMVMTEWRKNARALLSKRPLQVKFDWTWRVVKPRVLRIEGKTNLPHLTKVNLMVRDKDYDRLLSEHPKISWQVTNLTQYWDNLTVDKDGTFTTVHSSGSLMIDRCDLGSEPAKYPLRSDEYEIVLTVNPRVQPIPVQDRTGWSGEGIAGPHVTEIDGIRMIRKVVYLTKDELLQRPKVSRRP